MTTLSLNKSSPKTISLLSIEGCPECAEVKSRLEEMAKKHGFSIKEYVASIDNTEAIDFAILYDISEIPSIVVGNDVFPGSNWVEEDVVESLKKA